MDTGILYVQMFGGFSMKWNGTQIGGGPRARESQFTYLMQLLLHHRKEGVGRNLLEEALFGEREVGNVYHSLRSVLYNARKKLRQAGLPDVEYICRKKDVYYWTGEIPVEEDTAVFEACAERAQEEEDPERRLELLLEACYCYRGEFLPRQAGVIWAAQEARRLQARLYSCVEDAVVLLRIHEDWQRMKELGVYVSQISPFADWETVTMEALISMGAVEEARKLYDDTVEYYMQVQGFRPSARLGELLNRLGAQMEHRYAMLDAIQEELLEKNAGGGGYLCPWPIFEGIYHMVGRIMERSGQSVYLMLCTVVDSKGNPMEEGTLLEELSPRLQEAICRSVRRGDAVAKYGKGQYLVLLVNTTRENCSVVQKRINYKFVVGRQRTGVKYYVNSVVCPADIR